MLNIFRKNTKVIIWFIIACFGLLGGSATLMSRDTNQTFVGEFAGTKFTQKDFRLTSRLVEILFTEQDRDGMSIEDFAMYLLALKHIAVVNNLNASDYEVRLLIKELFGDEVAGNLVGYKQWVWNVFGTKPRDFEETIRTYILVRKARETVIEPQMRTNAKKHTGSDSDEAVQAEYATWKNKLIEEAGLKRY